MNLYEFNAGTVVVDKTNVDIIFMFDKEGNIVEDHDKKYTIKKVPVAIPLRFFL